MYRIITIMATIDKLHQVYNTKYPLNIAYIFSVLAIQAIILIHRKLQKQHQILIQPLLLLLQLLINLSSSDQRYAQTLNKHIYTHATSDRFRRKCARRKSQTRRAQGRAEVSSDI